jgi:hypothetical protein
MENVEANGSGQVEMGERGSGLLTMSVKKIRNEADPQRIDRRRFITFVPGDDTHGRMASLETAAKKSSFERPKRSENIERKMQEGKYFAPAGLRGLLQSDSE